MMAIQAMIIGVYFLSKIAISSYTINMWAGLFLFVPLTIAEIFLVIYGSIAE